MLEQLRQQKPARNWEKKGDKLVSVPLCIGDYYRDGKPNIFETKELLIRENETLEAGFERTGGIYVAKTDRGAEVQKVEGINEYGERYVREKGKTTEEQMRDWRYKNNHYKEEKSYASDNKENANKGMDVVVELQDGTMTRGATIDKNGVLSFGGISDFVADRKFLTKVKKIYLFYHDWDKDLPGKYSQEFDAVHNLAVEERLLDKCPLINGANMIVDSRTIDYRLASLLGKAAHYFPLEYKKNPSISARTTVQRNITLPYLRFWKNDHVSPEALALLQKIVWEKREVGRGAGIPVFAEAGEIRNYAPVEGKTKAIHFSPENGPNFLAEGILEGTNFEEPPSDGGFSSGSMPPKNLKDAGKAQYERIINMAAAYFENNKAKQNEVMLEKAQTNMREKAQVRMQETAHGKVQEKTKAKEERCENAENKTNVWQGDAKRQRFEKINAMSEGIEQDMKNAAEKAGENAQKNKAKRREAGETGATKITDKMQKEAEKIAMPVNLQKERPMQKITEGANEKTATKVQKIAELKVRKIKGIEFISENNKNEAGGQKNEIAGKINMAKAGVKPLEEDGKAPKGKIRIKARNVNAIKKMREREDAKEERYAKIDRTLAEEKKKNRRVAAILQKAISKPAA